MLNFGNGDIEFPLPSSAARAWSARSEKEKMKNKNLTNKLWQCHYRNRKKKFVTIVAMALPKMWGGKCGSKSGESKKKKVLRSQYFHNKSHVISYY